MLTRHTRILCCSFSRPFNTLQEATQFYKRIKPQQEHGFVDVLPYLSNTRDLDLTEALTAQATSKGDQQLVERIAAISAIQSDVQGLELSRDAVATLATSDFKMSPSLRLSYALLKDKCWYMRKAVKLESDYSYKPRFSQWVLSHPEKPDLNHPKAIARLEDRFNKLQHKDMSNVDTLMMVDYWLTRGQSTLAARCLENITLLESESLLLARSIITHTAWNMLPTLLSSLSCDRVNLATQLAFYSPHSKVLQTLLNVENTLESIESTALCLVQVQALGLASDKILNLITLLEMPATLKTQLALQLFHSGQQRLSLIVTAGLDETSFNDIAPIITGTKVLRARDLCVDFIQQLLKQDLHPVATFTLKQFIKLKRLQNLTHIKWVFYLNSKLKLRPEDISSLIKAVPLEQQPLLLKQSLEANLTSLIPEILRYNQEQGALVTLLSSLQVSVMSHDDYIEDCLLYYLSAEPGSIVLSVCRELADEGLVSKKMEAFWMVVGYSKKGDYVFAESVMESSEEMFGLTELSNLVIVCGGVVRERAEQLLSDFKAQQDHYEGMQGDVEALVDTKIPLKHLDENNFLAKVCEKHSVHLAVYLLLNSGMVKPYTPIVILLKQLKDNQAALKSFLTSYGFLMPVSYIDRLPEQFPDAEKLEQKILASIYFFSHCKNFKLDAYALKMLQVSKFTKREVTDKMFTFYLMYSNDVYVQRLVASRGLNEHDRTFFNLLKQKRKVEAPELDTKEELVDDFDYVLNDDFDNDLEDQLEDEIYDEE